MVIQYTNFGNFDDDDWDDHHKPPAPSTPAAPPPAVRQATVTSSPGSAPVIMHLDSGHLPVRLEFSALWNQQVARSAVSRELFAAYGLARRRLLEQAIRANGGWPERLPTHASATPRRKQLGLLLETSTWEQYQQTMRSFATFGEYHVHGQHLEHDEPVVTMAADRFSIKSIRVWPQWYGCTDASVLESEIIACADKIRSARPSFELKRDYSQYSDDQLEEWHRQHRIQLSRY
ncbi:hypothetical protein [Nocardia sp. CDC160]|uniref:hypothetical protein n=1 Tax=Nocardia sp. CDC160 TaxID=3112166 RepID=UPI002DBD0FE3|nr:hypothetical protein [Nocardia sp. CDC160]MEC3916022.1 hypothetical protein [Nocardia sp. CDC160]